MVIAAHADDEALGCGGTLARHCAEGCAVDFLFLADGVSARQQAYDPAACADARASRKEMAAAAAVAVGGLPPRFLDLPDNRLDRLDFLDVVKSVEAVIEDVRPSVVYTNHANDLNIDHRITHQAVLTACRPVAGCSVRAIYAFETLSSTEWAPTGSGQPFQPSRFVDISDYLDAKRAAVSAYSKEMHAFPHPRSLETIEALWKVRGAQAGMHAAEAFVVVRECF
jgi:LmbE family N-acetylglucosaminyl deacetylase